MRVLHFSDTHLGFQSYDNVTQEGVNAREQDVYIAFAWVIEEALKLKPDVVIHSGDFFHRPSPSNRALTFALEQLRKLCDAGIPLIVIAGNHETPKTVYTSPILRALNSMPCVQPIFGESWETIEIGEIAVHGVPHINDHRLLLQELDRMQPVPGKFNILMLHTSLGKRYLMEEYGEQIFPPEFESKLAQFQYIALGHWHNYQSVNMHPMAWYCGSIERLSDTEIDSEKGYMLLDIDRGECKTSFHTIPTRPWLKLELNNCRSQTVNELMAQLNAFAVANDTRGAILSIHFFDIDVRQSLEISNASLREIFPNCFQLLPKRRLWGEKGLQHDLDAKAFERIDQLFLGFVREQYREDPATAEKLAEKVKHYFKI